MEFMKSLFVLSITILLLQPFVSVADDAGFTAKPNEAIFQVHGVVCSFCSVGLQKKLSKLSFVDRSKYKKGIHVAIKDQRVTMALKPGSEVDLKEAYKSIKSGGYDLLKAVVADQNGNLTFYDKEGEICTECS